MCGGCKRFILLSVFIVALDLIRQVIGWIVIIGFYIYKTTNCTYYFYSNKCCAMQDFEEYIEICSSAKAVKGFFLAGIIGPLSVYFIFILFYFCICSARKGEVVEKCWDLLICTESLQIFFFLIPNQVPQNKNIVANFKIGDISIALGVITIVNLLVLCGISCDVFSLEEKQFSRVSVTQNQKHIQNLPNTENQQFFDQLIQAQYIRSWQQNHLQPINGLPVYGLPINQPAVNGKQEDGSPILLYPIEGQAINK